MGVVDRMIDPPLGGSRFESSKVDAIFNQK